MTRRVYIYAFDGLHKMVDCKFLEGDAITFDGIVYVRDRMIWKNDVIRAVYAIDNRTGLYRDYREAVKTQDFVKQFEFEDMVNREGICIMRK